MANLVSKIIVRSDAATKLRQQCGVTSNGDLSKHIGVTDSQISRVLSVSGNAPGNRFIAGVIAATGLGFAFREIFAISIEDET